MEHKSYIFDGRYLEFPLKDDRETCDKLRGLLARAPEPWWVRSDAYLAYSRTFRALRDTLTSDDVRLFWETSYKEALKQPADDRVLEDIDCGLAELEALFGLRPELFNEELRGEILNGLLDLLCRGTSPFNEMPLLFLAILFQRPDKRDFVMKLARARPKFVSYSEALAGFFKKDFYNLIEPEDRKALVKEWRASFEFAQTPLNQRSLLLQLLLLMFTKGERYLLTREFLDEALMFAVDVSDPDVWHDALKMAKIAKAEAPEMISLQLVARLKEWHERDSREPKFVKRVEWRWNDLKEILK